MKTNLIETKEVKKGRPFSVFRIGIIMVALVVLYSIISSAARFEDNGSKTQSNGTGDNGAQPTMNPVKEKEVLTSSETTTDIQEQAVTDKDAETANLNKPAISVYKDNPAPPDTTSDSDSQASSDVSSETSAKAVQDISSETSASQAVQDVSGETSGQSVPDTSIETANGLDLPEESAEPSGEFVLTDTELSCH